MTTPRGARLLKLLKDSDSGLRLPELVALFGEEGRDPEKAMMTMLFTMRQKGRVDYQPRPPDAAGRGGYYVITRAGEDYLASKLDFHPDWAEELGEGVMETGAMRGEYQTVVRRPASEAREPLPPMLPNWVFHLAQQKQRAGHCKATAVDR